MHGLSIYKCPAKRYRCDVAYTNRPVAGAFRGYGAPQDFFALESQMDDIALALGMDPVELRRRNWIRVGDRLDIVPRLGERGGAEEIAPEDLPQVISCGLEECVAQGQRAIGWSRREDPRGSANRRTARESRRGIGCGLAIQGSGIPFMDMGACSIKINDDGSFNLLVRGDGPRNRGRHRARPDRGRGARRPARRHHRVRSRHRLTPFDVGAYASSTTYISGMAVRRRPKPPGSASSPAPRGLLDIASPEDDRVARPAGLGTRRAIAFSRSDCTERSAHRGPGADHGHGVALVDCVAAAVRSAVRRGRGGHRHWTGAGGEARNGGRLRRTHQPRSRRAARSRVPWRKRSGTR